MSDIQPPPEGLLHAPALAAANQPPTQLKPAENTAPAPTPAEALAKARAERELTRKHVSEHYQKAALDAFIADREEISAALKLAAQRWEAERKDKEEEARRQFPDVRGAEWHAIREACKPDWPHEWRAGVVLGVKAVQLAAGIVDVLFPLPKESAPAAPAVIQAKQEGDRTEPPQQDSTGDDTNSKTTTKVVPASVSSAEALEPAPV